MVADAAPAEQFGPYLVYERLGIGGMAAVHRALERGIEGFERIVALKRLLPHLAEDASFIKAFVREAKLASLLTHVNIVQIFELGRVGTEYFISMEYIDGRDIRRLLRHARRVTGPPPIHVTVGLLLQLCEALDYAHTRVDDRGHPLGLVHRDVSPSNLLVTKAGHLKVIDFGIAKAQPTHLRTQTGRVKGKLAYMAPEAVAGKELDARSDLFAVGVIAHELLTARPLFASKNEYQTLLKVQRGEVPPPSTLNEACPAELDAIVLQALARDPNERFGSAAALRDAVHELCRRHNLQTGHRDVAQWIEWAFSIEPPSDGAAATSAIDPGRASHAQLEVHAAADLAWGGGEGEHAQGPVVLEDVPDVSDKHLAASFEGGGGGGNTPTPPASQPHVARSTSLELPLPAEPEATGRAGEDDGDDDDLLATWSRRRRRPALENITIGSAIIARQAGRGRWALLAGLLVAGAGAAAAAIYASGKAEESSAPADAKPPEAPARSVGTVKFVTVPEDAEIAIEGQPVHQGSPWAIELAAGVHQITIQRGGYKAWLTSLELSANETQLLRVVLEPLGAATASAEATLILSTTPPGLEVVLDGELLPQRTPLRMPIRPGRHVVAVRQDGADVWRHELDAKPSMNYEFTPSMAADKQRERAARSEPTPEPAPTPTPDRVAEARPTITDGDRSRAGAGHGGGAEATVERKIDSPQLPSISAIAPEPAAAAAAAAPRGPVLVAPTAVTRTGGATPAIDRARRDEVPPVVAAKLCIDAAGRVTSVDVLTKLERATASELGRALESWTYLPYQPQGTAVPACFAVSLRVK